MNLCNLSATKTVSNVFLCSIWFKGQWLVDEKENTIVLSSTYDMWLAAIGADCLLGGKMIKFCLLFSLQCPCHPVIYDIYWTYSVGELEPYD